MPMDIEELTEGVLQGCSGILGLNLQWEAGQLVRHDPATGQPILTLENERQDRLNEQARADSEQQARVAAEARIRELEEQLRNRNS